MTTRNVGLTKKKYELQRINLVAKQSVLQKLTSTSKMDKLKLGQSILTGQIDVLKLAESQIRYLKLANCNM